MLKQQLQDSINQIRTRLDKIDDEKAGTRIKGLEQKFIELNTNVRIWRAIIFSSVSFLVLLATVLTVLIAVYGFKISEQKKREIADDHLLMNQLRHNTTEVINTLFVLVRSPELTKAVNDLKTQQESIAELKPQGAEFESINKLIDAVRALILEEDEGKADTELKTLIDADNDRYATSRARAIRVLISLNQGCGFGGDSPKPAQRDKMREELMEAIKRDGTNALAFNCLGIINSNEADARRQNIKVANDRTALLASLESVNSARLNYEVAGGLDVSITGAHKRTNNIISANISAVKACLDSNCLDDKETAEKIIGYLGYATMEAFFQDSQGRLNEYITLRPSLLLAEFTEAELLCVKAQYLRSKHDSTAPRLDEIGKLLATAARLLLNTIKNGFYKAKSCNEAIKDFENDDLLFELVNDSKYKATIEAGITDVCHQQSGPKIKPKCIE